ncbi:S phase cyclin A-associated protein in the endoplasmic reticulum [Episyrphus balteatus]|uniref:S phase cyclin A-associated protein in the endoplasmic reticulum n=1 Tax=Episyrphus balteatus TaxID=286459 RepID=UPI0024865EBF|nr:S phase cyclin A-associated protein in the endoplasmic reticulum [Episyrphus balteatus]
MEMKKVLDKEGRDAKNLLAYQISSNNETPSSHERANLPLLRKPPRSPLLTPSRKHQQQLRSAKQNSGPRVRSASTGRDKKSELQARYWALLFGNLQRAVNEIYQTVECYENISSCQETILVLENYVRDFKALSEWFKVSWDYEATPLPQRPHSLTWEVRKSNPVPRVRAKSLSSPVSVSGKSSPCFSGKSSPCSTIEEKNLSPRKNFASKSATRVNIRELFSSSKKPPQTDNVLVITKAEECNKPQQQQQPQQPQSQEHPHQQEPPHDEETTKISWNEMVEMEIPLEISVEKRDQYAQTDLEDENLTLAEIREKIRKQEEQANESTQESECSVISREPTAVEMTIKKLTAMENEILAKDAKKPATPPTTEVKKIDPVKPVEPKKVQNSPLKYSSVVNRPPANRILGAAKVNSTRPTTRPVNSVQSVQKPQPAVTTRRFPIPKPANIPPTNVPRRNPISNAAPPPPLSARTNVRPTNTGSRLATRSRTMIEMPNKNQRPFQSKAASRKSSREDVTSSSSTLKASNERIGSSRGSVFDPQERRSEPKQLTIDSTHNDGGWLTVKNRRRSSLHWANRFNQPTGYASLPTLALLNEKEEQQRDEGRTSPPPQPPPSNRRLSKEKLATKPTPKVAPEKSLVKTLSKPEIKNAKAKVNSLPQRAPGKSILTSGSGLNSSSSSSGGPSNTRQTFIKRQKSDLTGLKITSLHKEYMRSEKFHKLPGQSRESNENLDKENISEVAKSATPDLDGDANKIDIKIQTNRDFSKAIGDLYQAVAANHTLSSCDESEEKDDTDCDEDQRKLLEEEESLRRQIRELENTEIDVDTETDETDCEVLLEKEREFDDDDNDAGVVFVEDENLSLETRYQALLSDMSWGEREEALATLQAYVSRHPGRAQELHQKLSSPSRRRSLQETLKKYQAKQNRAQQKRADLQKEKAIKIQHLLARVEDVKAAKQHLIEEKRLKMEGRLQRAAENRNQYLRQIIEKAHDEEKKLKEIVFIKTMEAQNKRLDLLESSKETEVRLQDLEQERQKKLEEKAAKEAAVERRRQELEQARQKKLEKMNETRLEKEQRIGKMQEQKEKQRQALAREKARDREERLLALQVQQQQTTEELQRKILQKQKESARRHEENIEHIRQRALELTIPGRNVDENGQREDGEDVEGDATNGDGDLSSTVSDVSREHSRGYKKKMKKLKQRMSLNAEEYLKELQPVPMHMKRESQVPKYLNLISKGGGPQGLERPLGQLVRLMAKAQVFDFQCFLLMDGLGIITNCVVTKGIEPNSEISKKAIILAVQLYRNACTLCPQIGRHSILGNSITALFDCLFQSLQLPEEKSPQHPVELSTELMLACTVALSPSYTKKHSHPKVLERLPDLISYAVATGLVEILSRRCMKIRESIEQHQSVVLSLLATLGFLTRFVDVCPPGSADSTRFLSAAKSTELFGSISMLYSSVVPIGECIPPRTISLAAATFNLLVSMAVLDLTTFQEVLSGESLSLKFLDVVTILLKYCGNKCSANKNSETQAVIIDLIATIGFFCANNKKHQDLLTSEQSSIIIKSLTKLPEHLNVVIYPCLVTITFQNEEARKVISRDFSLEFLDEYSKSEKAKKNHLVALLKDTT